jgi:hypothetical protein
MLTRTSGTTTSKRAVRIAAAGCFAAAATYAGVALASGPSPVAPRIDAVPTDTPVAHHVQTVAGARWAIKTFENAEGETCAGETVPDDAGEGGQALGCFDLAAALEADAVVPFFGGRQVRDHVWANVWIWGFAAPGVDRVSVVDEATGAITPLHVDRDGVFFRVFGAGHTTGPWELRAYRSDGSLAFAREFALPTATAARVGG